MSEKRELDESETYALAVGLLARREHSARELATKLRGRGCGAERVETVLARLIAERLQSDERFAEAYIHQRSAKGYGPLRIVAELRERGIDDGLTTAQMRRAEEAGEVDWFEQAAAAYRKKFGAAAETPTEMKERAKRMRFLQYRGFSHEQIAAAIGDE